MFDFNPFDTDMEGNVDGIDFLGFDYLMRRVLQPEEDEQDSDAWKCSCTEDEWDDAAQTEHDY